ncbi:hypothetical protein GE09DRAFT_1157949 [Coniochaeta sp. 2T2.1]|nr:hypothetical protein GE09DRAFT_1157949 [Coniochaeta sp. 2T2.1]
MQWLVILTLLTTYANEVLSACSGNNCLRALQREPTSNRNGTADCISFFKVTVTPTPSTVRSTVTVTSTLLSPDKKKRGLPELGHIHNMYSVHGPVHMVQVIPGNVLQKRQTTVSPTAIPAYAAPCSSIAAYSSACSCIGAPRTTITAEAATTTSMITVTETFTPSLPTRVVNITTDTPSSITSSSKSTTARPTLSSNSTGIYANTTSTPTYTPTGIVDTSPCGETSTPFTLQVSQPGGTFDGWYAHLSGAGVLFTSAASSATRFSVEQSGHLCAVGYEGEYGYPVIAVVTNLTATGEVWLVDARRAHALREDYVPIECSSTGGELACRAGATSKWLGCGLQLELTSETGEVVVGDGISCSAISLGVV